MFASREMACQYFVNGTADGLSIKSCADKGHETEVALYTKEAGEL